MSGSSVLARGRKALRMPPRQVLGRLRDMIGEQARRPWSRVYPRLLGDASLFGSSGARSIDTLWMRLMDQPFFVRPSERQAFVDAFNAAFPDEASALVAIADLALRHEFDLLGSGTVSLGPQLPWLDDFKSGRHYPLQYCRDIEYMELDKPTDVKVPWELSRCQHFTALGQAYWLTGDERYAREYVAEIRDWIDRNPFAYSVNWACAMDVALRAISWIWGFSFMSGSAACADEEFRRAMLRSLFLHGEFIATHLETSDVNGNHYLTDGAGLVFLGLFFKHTTNGQRWLSLGTRIVFDEISNQVSDDGVDFEQSTAYHRLVLELFFTSYLLLERHGNQVPARQWERLSRMLDFVAAYTKPDGLAPLIGDADDGRVQKLGTQSLNDHRYLLAAGAVRLDRPEFKQAAGKMWSEALWLLGADAVSRFAAIPDPSTSPSSVAFPRGGFFVLRGRSAHLVIDCGEVGMRGRGGHGHNDILGFELFMDGVNLVTDCGAYLYTSSREWRNRFRGTAFHNVVQVGDEELNRFVSEDALWQLMDDARPVDPRLVTGADGDYFSGGHDGFERLSSPVTVTRECFVDRDRPRVVVRDRLAASGRRHLTLRFHFDPSVAAECVDRDCRLRAADRDLWLLAVDDTETERRVEPGWVSPSYGVRRQASVLVIESHGALPVEMTHLFAETRLPAGERRLALEQLDAHAGLVVRPG